MLTKVKPSSEPLEKKGVIYQQSCGECQLKYVGETGRRAVVRKKEHLTSFKKADTKSAISEHAWETSHTPSQDSFTIIHREPH